MWWTDQPVTACPSLQARKCHPRFLSFSQLLLPSVTKSYPLCKSYCTWNGLFLSVSAVLLSTHLDIDMVFLQVFLPVHLAPSKLPFTLRPENANLTVLFSAQNFSLAPHYYVVKPTQFSGGSLPWHTLSLFSVNFFHDIYHHLKSYLLYFFFFGQSFPFKWKLHQGQKFLCFAYWCIYRA